MSWTSTSSADTTWQAVTPGTSVSNTLLSQIQAEAAAADASATAAAASAVDASGYASAASASAAAASSSASAAADSAVDASSFATQAQSAAASLTPIPAGGTTGQSLVKNSATDYDYAWATVSGGGGSLAFQDEGSLVLASPTNVNFVGAGVTVTDVAGVATVTIPGGGAVSSVFGRSGAVTAQSGDYTFAQLASTPTTLAGYGITDAASSSHTHTFASLTSKPTTLAGYGITDAAASSHTHAASDIVSGTVATARLGSGTASASNFLRGDQSWAAPTFAQIASTPTTLAGYGITDAASSSHTHTFASLTSKPTTLAGYGITDAAASSHTHATSDITSGTFADARIAASNVTQHQASLALAGNQITSGTVDPARLGSGSSITTKFLRGDSTWQTIAGGGDALTTNPLSQFAATTSAQLAGVISDETGSGALVFANSPTFTTPNIGTATGSISGNAGTATALQTARTINGVSFDGTTNITVTAAAGTLTGATLASGVTASSLTSVGTLTSLTMGGLLTTVASGTGSAGFRLPHGTAPSSPVNGDIWTTTSGIFVRVNGTTASLGDAITFNPLSQFASTTSAQLAGVISDETGSGALVFGTSPTLTTPTLAAATMSGQLSCADQVVERPYFKDFAETRSTPSISAGALTVDYSAGNVAVVTMNANVTSLTLSNPPASGRIGELTLILKQDATGSRTVTWPAAVKWPGGTAPTLSGANKVDIITLVTDDAGTNWYGSSAVNY